MPQCESGASPHQTQTSRNGTGGLDIAQDASADKNCTARPAVARVGTEAFVFIRCNSSQNFSSQYANQAETHVR